MADGSHIFVVLDPEYGEAVVKLVRKGPVWILDTPTNRDSVRKRRTLTGTFHAKLFESAEGARHGCDAINKRLMTEIHLQQWHAGCPCLKTLEVVGAFLDEETKSRLSHFGFVEFEPTADGFIAVLGDAVPDETTAIVQAKWHLAHEFGEQEVARFQHFDVTLNDGIWTVQAISESSSESDPAQLRIRIDKVDGSTHEIWRSFR